MNLQLNSKFLLIQNKTKSEKNVNFLTAIRIRDLKTNLGKCHTKELNELSRGAAASVCKYNKKIVNKKL